MTQATRRDVIASVATGAAAAAVSPVLQSSTAHAATAQSGKQVAGWYRYKVGDFEITAVTDGINRFPLPDTFVRNAKKEEVSAALAAAFVDTGTLAVPYTPIVVNTGSKLIVIDTGTGEANFTNSKGAAGQFLTNLAAAGIDPKSVDTVIISHYHGDHINGLLLANGQPTYPNAEILVPEAEHKFWTDDAEMGRLQRLEGAFKNARRVFNVEIMKRVTTYQASKEIAPGITAVSTHGHTPGHTSHVISSAGKTVFVQADITNLPYLFARNPQWHAMFDMNGEQAEETRRKTYDMLAADRTMVQGFHYPFPAVAYIEKSGNGYRENPVPWSPTL